VEKKAALRIAQSPRDAWDGAIWGWFQRVLAVSSQQSRPSLVALATRSHAHALKARLLQEGQSHLGIYFVTPAGLRDLLSRDRDPALPLREHLRLLLAASAEKILHESAGNETSADHLAAKAVVRAPDHLLRTLDRLEAAGWDFEQLGLDSFSPIIRRFREQLRRCDFSFTAQFDRELLARWQSEPPIFEHLLVSGFDAAHWPHWFLLRAAVQAARNATVVLEEQHGELADSDSCWIGSWEEICGEAQRAQKPAQNRGEAFFSEAEMRGEAEPAKRFDFFIGTNATEQAEAIAAQCVRYLAEEKCTRLGVIFPGFGALPRLVASALARLDILHNDGLAHLLPGIFESAEWQAWLELQRTPRLNSFLRFLNALPDPAVLSPTLSRHVFENVLRESYAEVLLNDLEILREFCARGDDKFQSAAAALRAFPFLPARATLAQFLEATHASLRRLGWKQHSLELANVSHSWPARFEATFSRALFLRWLEETAATFGAARAPAGDHPYARVQLLTVAEAQNQEWSHLIFAGWNDGAWPPPAGAEFARTEEIRAFNRGVQQLNQRATRQGSQGEGHTSIRENHSLYLGPIEQRAIALRQFEALLDSAPEAVTLTASLVQEDAPERFWNPSESFTQLYRKTRREPLTQGALKNLQRATAKWLEAARGLKQTSLPRSGEVEQTLHAFNARRDPLKCAGEYDFGLRPNESYRPVPRLSVSDLERMVASPAIIWMKRYLGVEAPDDATRPWAATSGKWVHGWLAGIGETKEGKLFARFPSPPEIDERIRVSADERRAALQQLCHSLGKVVPVWWTSGWLNARYLARYLGGKIGSVEDWNWMATEFSIGREGPVKITDDIELFLRGQIDLILAQNDAADFAGQRVWIVDYKTGATKELKSSDLHDSLVKGTTLQLGLYSLALRELGAAEVEMSILSLAVKSVTRQLAVGALMEHTNVFADLAVMQQNGIFGMKREVRPVFGYTAPYPLATLPIDNDILEDKWALTHPNLVLEKEEGEGW
jgi:hypothetical protein